MPDAAVLKLPVHSRKHGFSEDGYLMAGAGGLGGTGKVGRELVEYLATGGSSMVQQDMGVENNMCNSMSVGSGTSHMLEVASGTCPFLLQFCMAQCNFILLLLEPGTDWDGNQWVCI